MNEIEQELVVTYRVYPPLTYARYEKGVGLVDGEASKPSFVEHIRSAPGKDSPEKMFERAKKLWEGRGRTISLVSYGFEVKPQPLSPVDSVRNGDSVLKLTVKELDKKIKFYI